MTPQVISSEDFIDWLSGRPNPAIDNRGPHNPIQINDEVNYAFKQTGIARSRLEGMIFAEKLDLSGVKFSAALELVNCSVAQLILRGAEFDNSLSIVGGSYRNGILLSYARIAGSILIRSPAHQLVVGNLDLMGIRIDGSLSIGAQNDMDLDTVGRIRVQGGIVLSEAKIDGTLFVRDAEIQTLDLSNACIGGNVYLTQIGGPDRSLTISDSIVVSNAAITGNFVLEGADIARDLILDNASVGGNIFVKPKMSASLAVAIGGDVKIAGTLSARSLSCRGEVALQGADIGGDVILEFSEIAALWAFPAESSRVQIGGSLRLSRILTRPWIRLEGISIKGDVRVLGSEFSAFYVTVGWISNAADPNGELLAHEHSIIPSTLGRFLMASSKVYGNLSMPFIQINGTVSVTDRQGLFVENSMIDGEVALWSPYEFHDMWQGRFGNDECPLYPWRYSAAVIGEIRICYSKLQGKLNLSFAKATGQISVTDTEVKGGVQFCSTLTVNADLGDESQRNRLAAEDILNPLMRASAAGASLRMSRIDSDIDLTGLSIFYDRNGPWWTERSGTIDATQASVRGTIRAHNEAPAQEAYVEVPGKFNLSNVTAARLEVSGHSFPSNLPGPYPILGDKYHNGLILAGGTIGEIRIPEIGSYRPFPIAFANLSVTSWEVPDPDGVSNYRKLVKKDAEFRRSNYTSLERYLRNRGQDDHANAIYRDMRWKELKAIPVAWHWRILLNLHGYVLGFGTKLLRLFVLIAFVGLLAYPLYRHPANIEASLKRLAVDAARETAKESMRTVGESPSPSDWSAADAFWMEVRFHIPIVAMGMRDEWTPRDNNHTIYDIAAFSYSRPMCAPASTVPPRIEVDAPEKRGIARPCDKSFAFVLPFSTEDLAGSFAIVNYLMWPLLLAFALRNVVRLRGTQSE
jgi:hypothetical protein